MKRLLLLVVALAVITSGCIRRNEKELPSQRQPEAENQEAALDSLLEGMTPEEKVGQLLMVGIEGTELDGDTAKFLKERRIGGVILFGRNIQSVEQAAALTEALKGLETGPGGVGMLIGTDQEGGRVNRLPGERGKFPSAKALAADGGPERVREAAGEMAAQLKEMGINLNFAPILDINSNPNNPVIGDRAFGSDPETVSKMGLAFIRGTLDQGIIPVAKHFPGHGDTLVDSHTDLPVVENTMDRLQSFELVPFKKAVEGGIPAIMSAHMLLPQIDSDNPATLSPEIIGGILRERLGFDGVVVSDDLDMGAITKLYSPGEAAVRAVKAGIDIVLIGHTRDNMASVFDALAEALRSGEIDQETIDRAVKRVLVLKERFGLVEK
ncbi:MAG TPA: beta-N-acetylhexosaminidase [Clostridia bacterium]|nr:beta-N-acetylhexosaminidase [Clostridia bacterium]